MISPANELAVAVVFAPWCSKLVRNHMPTFATWCQSSGVLSSNLYQSPSFPKHRRTRAEDHRPPSLIAGPLQAVPDRKKALGEFPLSSFTFPYRPFVESCVKSLEQPTPTSFPRFRPWRSTGITVVGSSALSPFPAFNPGHQSQIQRPALARTLSPGYFVKEPLKFFQIEPAVQSTFYEIRLLSLENVFY